MTTIKTTPAPRRTVRLPVDLMFGPSDLLLSGTSCNMSISGMLVLTQDPKPAGTPVYFKFDEFEGWGDVVWSRTGELGGVYVGIRFKTMNARSRSVLIEILRDSPPHI